MIKKLAFIGMGIMGLPMATHLLEAGFGLKVYTRTKSRASRLITQGRLPRRCRHRG
jgi:3-hydroxyisobutyrate dehydrogenase